MNYILYSFDLFYFIFSYFSLIKIKSFEEENFENIKKKKKK